MSKGEPKTCVSCGFIAADEDVYCIRCGSPLINKCSDEKGLLDKGCSFVNKSDASYCAKCGSPTTFNKLGLL